MSQDSAATHTGETSPGVAVQPSAVAGQPQLRVLWKFLVHVVVGTLLFAVIFAPAIGLNLLVGWLSDMGGISRLLLLILEVAEYVLVTVDTVLFFVFLGKTTWRTIKDL